MLWEQAGSKACGASAAAAWRGSLRLTGVAVAGWAGPQGTRDFFDSFFTLNDFFWRGFLSAHLDLPNLIKFGLALFVNACPDAKFNILSKGITGLPIMLGRVANAPFYMSYD